MNDVATRILELAQQLGVALREQRLLLTTAESCTAGGVAFAVTQVPGSSGWYDRGFITYSNDAKIRQLGVSRVYLRDFGAVSEPVARAMAVGAITGSQAQIAVAITGIAGPDGGTPDKPVGTVCFGFAIKRDAAAPAWVKTVTRHFEGDRAEIRHASIVAALEGLVDLLRQRQDV